MARVTKSLVGFAALLASCNISKPPPDPSEASSSSVVRNTAAASVLTPPPNAANTTSPLDSGARPSTKSQLTYEALLGSVEQARSVVSKATYAITAKCMEAAGFQFVTPSEAPESTPTRALEVWNFPNESEAADSGYLPPVVPSDAPLPAEPSLGAAYEAALYGKVVGQWEADPNAPRYAGAPLGGDIYDGCLPTAEAQIEGGGDPAKSFRLNDIAYQLQDVRSSARTRSMADQLWLQAQSLWVDCMRAQGYKYVSITDPLAEPWPELRPGAAERKAASADWLCKVQSGIPSLGDTLQTRYFEEALVEYSSDSQELSVELDAMTLRAKNELGP